MRWWLVKWKVKLSVLFIKLVGLKSKMHSLVKLDHKETNKAKGNNKDVENMKHEEHVFKQIVFKEKNEA